MDLKRNRWVEGQGGRSGVVMQGLGTGEAIPGNRLWHSWGEKVIVTGRVIGVIPRGLVKLPCGSKQQVPW